MAQSEDPLLGLNERRRTKLGRRRHTRTGGAEKSAMDGGFFISRKPVLSELHDTLEKLPVWPHSRIDELLPFTAEQIETIKQDLPEKST